MIEAQLENGSDTEEEEEDGCEEDGEDDEAKALDLGTNILHG